MTTSLQLGVIHEPLLIFGGPYSNYQAMQALLQVVEQRGIPSQRVICTGDVVAYCAEPEATTRLLRESGMPVVKGNCEQSLAANAADCGCGFEAGSSCDVLTDSWYPFARQHLSAESKAWMAALPDAIHVEMQGRTFLVVHGSVSQINRFVFASSPRQDKRAELARAGVDCVIAGHCGIPFGQQVGNKFWLNAGAIGMPANDGTRDGWYLLLEPVEQGVQASWHRLRYDAPAACAAMRQAGLANGYADALLSGHWPSMDVLPAGERQRQGEAIHLPAMQF